MVLLKRYGKTPHSAKKKSTSCDLYLITDNLIRVKSTLVKLILTLGVNDIVISIKYFTLKIGLVVS